MSKIKVTFVETNCKKNGRLYVGELTFYHCSGFAPIQPEEWAIKMGDWIKLPTSK